MRYRRYIGWQYRCDQVIAVLTLACLFAIAAPALSSDAVTRPKIALVLSGGGARGIAHIGVLKVLEELRVPIDIIVGTSMGAIVGGTYASGVSPQEMEDRIREAKWDHILKDSLPRADQSVRSKERERRNIFGVELGYRDGEIRLPLGAVFGQQLDVFLAMLTESRSNFDSFDNLTIPYRAVATDIETGAMVVLDHGDLTQAMRASMSVPGAFAPKEIDGKLLVDGSLVRNLPIDVARNLGADIIIAVNVGTQLLKREEISSVIGVGTQMLYILTEQNVQVSLSELRGADVLISPELGEFSSGNFPESASTIAIGEAAARLRNSALAKHSLPVELYGQYLQMRRARANTPDRIAAVRIDTGGLKKVNPKFIEASIDIQSGEMPQLEKLQSDIEKLYASDDFQQISYRFEEQHGQRVLVLVPVEKAWGPNYLQFGSNLSTDLRGDSSFDILLDHRMTWLNSWGLEWRNEISLGRTTSWHSELNQPLNRTRTIFVAPFIDIRQTRDNIFLEDDPIVAYETRRMVAGIDLGLRLTNAATLRLGYSAGKIKSSPAVALPFFPNLEQRVGEFSARIIYDRLDNWAFPSSGWYANSEFISSRESLGAEQDFRSLKGEIATAYSIGAHRFVFGIRAGSDLGTELPIFNQFSLGGFLNLSGLQNRQLLGPRFGLSRAIYYRRFGGGGSLFSMPAYLGASLEAGNVRDRFNGTQSPGAIFAGSIFGALDTTFGPFYVAIGFAEGGRYAFYLFLGRP